MIGARLKVARAASGLSLRELAAAMGDVVSAQAIGKYERNEDMPSSRVLRALSDALQASEEYLLSDDDLVLEGIEFRKPAQSSREEATIEARTIQLLERYLAVEAALHLRSVDWEKPRGAPFAIRDIRDAEDAARSVREDWGLGNDPIPKLAELLEERGIKVLSLDLAEIDGLAAQVRRKNQTAARVIVVRKDTWSERKRFNLAHELGHMCMKIEGAIDVEKAAHRFASALLMPADAIRAEVGAKRSFISVGELVPLKLRFGASLQAIAFRCKDLGIINQAAFGRLFGLFGQRGWRRPPYEEPGCIPPSYEEPKRFERLCYRALAEDAISEARAAELLGISAHELNKRLDAGVA